MGEKKKWGDRRDGKLLRNLDAMHFIMPNIYPNRCDNEAYISERIDLTRLNEYLKEKNYDGIEYKYNLFQVLVTAVLKVITLRPKMNIFVANKNYYMRNEVTAAFVVKKIFSDDSEEGLAFIHAKKDDTIDTIHNEILRQVSSCRKNEKTGTDEGLDFFNKAPRFLSKFLLKIVCLLDKHGKVPKSLVSSDPFYASVVFSNLGSIKLKSGYHHLNNWGTNSLFIVVGEKKIRPFYKENGEYEMHDSVDIGLTVDERIADGYYFSKTVRLLKKLLEEPHLLEKTLDEEVEY